MSPANPDAANSAKSIPRERCHAAAAGSGASWRGCRARRLAVAARRALLTCTSRRSPAALRRCPAHRRRWSGSRCCRRAASSWDAAPPWTAMEGRCEVHVEQAPQVFRLVTKDEAIDADAGIVHQELQLVQFLGDSSAALARALCRTATRDL